MPDLPRHRAYSLLASTGLLVALALLLLGTLATGARAAEATGYGELQRFGETGDGTGLLDESRTRAIGVNPTDNSVFLLDEPEAPSANAEETEITRHFRLQKFESVAGTYTAVATATFNETSPQTGTQPEPAVDGLAVDPAAKHVYLLAVDARLPTLKHDARGSGNKTLLAASTLYAFSTEVAGGKLAGAGKEGPNNEVLAGPSVFSTQSETAGKALLDPHGIALDPATGELIVLAHIDTKGAKEDNVASSADHYVLQRVLASGALGNQYVDSTDGLKKSEGLPFTPKPSSPIVVNASGKEHVYVGYGGLEEIPYDFTSAAAPKFIEAARNPEEGIELGISAAPEGGRLTASPEGVIFGAGGAIVNELPGGETRGGVIAFSGTDGSEIGWSGGQMEREVEAKKIDDHCVITPYPYGLSHRIAAGSEGKLFALAPEFLLRFEPQEEEESEEEEPPVPLKGPFFPAIVEFGPGGTGCQEASAAAPVAKVNGEEVKGEAPVKPGSTVMFSSHIKQADALRVEWNFGDGSAKVVVPTDQYQNTKVEHKFEHEGTFTITETITEDDLAAAGQAVYHEGKLTSPTLTAARKLNVKVPGPTAVITGPSALKTGQLATYDGSLSTDPNHSPITKYAWDFGDGTTETTSTSKVTHTYTKGGSYTVSLTVTDELGLSSSPTTLHVTVTEPKIEPEPEPPHEKTEPPHEKTEPPGKTEVLSYKASVAGTTLAVSPTGALSLKIDCAGQSSCSGTVTLKTLTAVAAAHKHKAILTLASATFSTAAGRVVVVKLHLSAKARALLARVHTLRARATILGRDSSGTVHPMQAVVTLKAPRGHGKH